MINFLLSVNTYDLLIMAAYIAAFIVYHKRIAYWVMLSCIFIVMLIPVGDDATWPYIGFSVIYLIAGYLLYLSRLYLPALSASIMSLYCLYFSYDAWMNPNAETWVFNNHENIVVGIHIFILFSISKRLRNVVVTAHYDITHPRRYTAFNIFNHNSYKRRKGAEVYKK